MNSNSRFLILPLLALVFIFQACSDDDNNEVSREDLLTDTWEIQSKELTDYTITVNYNGVSLPITKATADALTEPQEVVAFINQFETTLEELADEFFPDNTTITFNEDNTYVIANDQASSTPETWSLNSDEQELTIDINNTEIDRLVFEIQELTDNSLRVFLTIDESDFDLELEEVERFTIEYTFSFTK